MVIASIVGEVRSSTIRVAALPSPKKEFKLTGDSDGKSKGCELEGDHGELWQGVVRLERLVAAGGEGPGKGGRDGSERQETSRRASGRGRELFTFVLISARVRFPRSYTRRSITPCFLSRAIRQNPGGDK